MGVFIRRRFVSEAPPTPTEPDNCLIFKGKDNVDFTLTIGYKEWDGTLEYSTDGATWSEIDAAGTFNSANARLYLRGLSNTTFRTSSGARITCNNPVYCEGDIRTLLNYENVENADMANNAFRRFFYNNQYLLSAPNLPALTLSAYCYTEMFYQCTRLIKAPDLPATALTGNCYNNMFAYCTSLVTAPNILATTLSSNCCTQMFYHCTSLTTPPALNATTLVTACYQNMFNGCTALKVNENDGTLFFTCPTTIPTNAVANMFNNTAGEFIGTPAAGASYYYT